MSDQPKRKARRATSADVVAEPAPVSQPASPPVKVEQPAVKVKVWVTAPKPEWNNDIFRAILAADKTAKSGGSNKSGWISIITTLSGSDLTAALSKWIGVVAVRKNGETGALIVLESA